VDLQPQRYIALRTSLGGTRVQIPPPRLFMPNPMRAIEFRAPR
jgi:hypothetical protein